jgi:spore maturation protein CgeB
MKIVVFGLSITSAWGNGHATTFRALLEALHRRGHDILFYEKDLEWYASNRDLPQPSFCRLRLYDSWSSIVSEIRRELASADAGLVGSYFPDGIAAIDELLDSRAGAKAFYDIDTPITVGARSAVPLYCSFDPREYRRFGRNKRFACDLSYMGTYAADRQAKLEELLVRPAMQSPDKHFIVAGPQYPKDIRWAKNIRRIVHLNPRWHARFYSSSRLNLNVTRREMVMAGYSPSVRLFEAAACGAAIVSDNWAGIESFFIPGREILLPVDADDVLRYLSLSDSELRAIGDAAQQRVLAEHTSEVRALQFESAVERSQQQQNLSTSVMVN